MISTPSPSLSHAFDFDLLVIGGGSGGVRGARMAAATGAKVALVEGDRMGGTCVIRGCVPKKLLSYAAHGFEEVSLLSGYGYSAERPSFDWRKLITAKDKEINRLEGIYNSLLETAKVDILRGWATFIDAHTLKITGPDGPQTYSAHIILIATGGHVSVPQIPGAEHFITSNEAFDLDALPERIAVYGGGYIGVEFASIFNGLGRETHLVYRGDKPLRGFDEQVRDHLKGELENKGLHLHMGRSIAGIEAAGAAKLLTLSDGTTLEVDLVMAATGRTPMVDGLGLAAAGVALNAQGAIAVDGYSKTSVDHIYAVGDVTERMTLTPVAINEAMAFVDTVFRNTPRAQSYANIATAVFSNPEVCTLGMTEAQAREAYPAGRVYTATFRAMKHILPAYSERTFMKLIVEDADDRVVGLHIVGQAAAEMVQGFAVALNAGATKAQFDATVGIHPTSAEELVTMRVPTSTWGR